MAVLEHCARALSGGDTVRARVHPQEPHVLHALRGLRGVLGGKVEILPAWGLDYDQRNRRAGIWIDVSLALTGAVLMLRGR